MRISLNNLATVKDQAILDDDPHDLWIAQSDAASWPDPSTADDLDLDPLCPRL